MCSRSHKSAMNLQRNLKIIVASAGIGARRHAARLSLESYFRAIGAGDLCQ